ncbi:hypothetical protein PVAP13_9NG766277 [Panicum virgatum]|uniref:Uncharacterized protein n=1 Tax=Panicum virgatum TaxID=38727 RepID=A0A8T0N6D4_PANVG|nr:hypothetical protein PVAP13_9NG766277 [Panicum virgatum]
MSAGKGATADEGRQAAEAGDASATADEGRRGGRWPGLATQARRPTRGSGAAWLERRGSACRSAARRILGPGWRLARASGGRWAADVSGGLTGGVVAGKVGIGISGQGGRCRWGWSQANEDELMMV